MSKTAKTKGNALTQPVNADEIYNGFGGEETQDVPTGTQLPLIEIMRESQQFKMPDGTFVTGFTGHVLYHHCVNQLYHAEYGQGDQFGPDCYSVDGAECSGGLFPFELYDIQLSSKFTEFLKLTDAPDSVTLDPIGNQLHTQVHLNRAYADGNIPPLDRKLVDRCAMCPANQYGSSLSSPNGKYCQNSIWMYILLDGDTIPCRLKAPPSSLGKDSSVMNYFPAAINKSGKARKYQLVKSKFALAKKEFKTSGFEASCLVMEPLEALAGTDPHIHTLIRLYKDLHKCYLAHLHEEVEKDLNQNS